MLIQSWRNQTALRIGREQQKRWPLHEKVLAAGPAYVNVAQKVRSALMQIDRVLDVFEPGQLALSFNGSKDDTVLLHLFIEACKHHPTHSFTHIQPVWFRDPEHEHSEVMEYISRTANQHFMHRHDLLSQSPSQDRTSRLWTMHVGRDSKQFIDAVIYLSQQTAIRCLILGNRRTDTGCRDLAHISLMDLAPILLSGSMSRMKLETKIIMLQFESDPGFVRLASPITTYPKLHSRSRPLPLPPDMLSNIPAAGFLAHGRARCASLPCSATAQPWSGPIVTSGTSSDALASTTAPSTTRDTQ